MVVITETGIISIIGIGAGACLSIMRLFYKSKCTDINICCCSFKRDIETEQKIDENRPPTRPSSADSIDYFNNKIMMTENRLAPPSPSNIHR
jgi:hypothetical protein